MTLFELSHSDELGLRVGETLRVIKEFEDEWCLVQRIGPPDAEKGVRVVPSCCLAKNPHIFTCFSLPPQLTDHSDLPRARSLFPHVPWPLSAECLLSCSGGLLSPTSRLDAGGSLGRGRCSAHDR